MGDNIKLNIFRGTGVEDPNQHFFLCKVVWNIKQLQNDDTKTFTVHGLAIGRLSITKM